MREGEIVLTNGSTVPFDLCCWATGPEPHDVTSKLELELSMKQLGESHVSGPKGFIAVTKTLQTKSDPNIFASGDCADIENAPWVQKAGVFAVREVCWTCCSIYNSRDP